MTDISELLNKAIDDANNDCLLGLTTVKIKEMNLKVINELGLIKEDALGILRKLVDYKYVDEMDDLKYGTYIRWIKLDNPEDLNLTKGAIFSDIKITDRGVNLICKNFGNQRKRFMIQMNDCLIFRKLTNQELVLLSALDHLSDDK